MTNFYVTQKEGGGYVGLMTLGEIRTRLAAGELKESFFVTESDGRSYNQFRKSGNGTWRTLGTLLTEYPVGQSQWHTKSGVFASATQPAYRSMHMKSQHNQTDALRRISDGSADAPESTEPTLRHAENVPLAPAMAAALLLAMVVGIMMLPAALAITAVLDTRALRDTPESGEEQLTTAEHVATSMAICASYFFAGFFLVSIRDSENMADATSLASLKLLLSLIGQRHFRFCVAG